MQQRSEEWFAARRGKITASRLADLMTRTKTGYGASRANYMAELIVEKLTGMTAESYSNSAMEWGTATEPQAIAAYSFMGDVVVEEAGFVLHASIAHFGASPDGFVGQDGLVEIKCPSTATHIDTLLNNTVEGKYVTQMQAQMACTGRQWCDFVSFDPRVPAEMHLWTKRVMRDAVRIAEIEEQVRVFLGELDAKISALAEKYGAAA